MARSVRIRNVAMQMQIVDGQSLLTPALLDQIVAAVMQEMQGHREDERTRQRDVEIGGDCGCGGGGEHT